MCSQLDVMWLESLGRKLSLSCMYCIFHIFWEGHKFLRNLHRRFVLCSNGQIYGGYFAKFCGLLRIYKLYVDDTGVNRFLESQARSITLSKSDRPLFYFFKAHIFWDGHKILQNLHLILDHYYIGQIYGGDFLEYMNFIKDTWFCNPLNIIIYWTTNILSLWLKSCFPPTYYLLY